jgi:hypothetical protein
MKGTGSAGVVSEGAAVSVGFGDTVVSDPAGSVDVMAGSGVEVGATVVSGVGVVEPGPAGVAGLVVVVVGIGGVGLAPVVVPLGFVAMGVVFTVEAPGPGVIAAGPAGGTLTPVFVAVGTLGPIADCVTHVLFSQARPGSQVPAEHSQPAEPAAHSGVFDSPQWVSANNDPSPRQAKQMRVTIDERMRGALQKPAKLAGHRIIGEKRAERTAQSGVCVSRDPTRPPKCGQSQMFLLEGKSTRRSVLRRGASRSE